MTKKHVRKLDGLKRLVPNRVWMWGYWEIHHFQHVYPPELGKPDLHTWIAFDTWATFSSPQRLAYSFASDGSLRSFVKKLMAYGPKLGH